jgi:hypothetical protein
MPESKKPTRQAPRNRSSFPRGQRPSDPLKAADPAARIETLETSLAQATGDIAALRLSVEAILAELDDLRARVAAGLTRPRMQPPPLPHESNSEIIAVDDREVTLESIRPKKPR